MQPLTTAKTIAGMISSCLLTSTLVAQPLEYFLQQAQKNSPLLRAAQHRSQAAKYAYHGQSMLKNPVLGVSHSNSPIGTWPALNQHAMSGISISIKQTIAFPWEDYQRKSALEEKYFSSKQRAIEAQNQLELRVHQQYHELYFLLRKKQILAENKQALSDIVKVARALVAVNKMSSAQLLKLEANLSLIENKILKTDANLEKARAQMEKVCGVNLEWKLDDVASWMVPSDQLTPRRQFAAVQHPLLRKMKYQLKAEQAMASQERAKLFPGVTLGGAYRFRQQVNGMGGEDFISVSASMPLPLYYPLKERHKISAQDARVAAVKQEMRDVQLMLEKSWSGEAARVDNLLKAYSNFEKEVKPKYFASYKAQLGSLASGTVSLLDVLDAYRNYLSISINEAKLYADLRSGMAMLEYLAYGEQKQENNERI